MRNNKKSTVKAAMAQIKRDTKTSPKPTPQNTQGSLADRHVRAHTPESFYGDEGATTAE